MGIWSRIKKKAKRAGGITKRVAKRAARKVPGKKIVKLAGKGLKVAGRTGLLKKALGAVPFVGSAYAAYDIASSIGGMMGKKSSGGLPALPMGKISAAGLPAAMGGTGGTGVIPKGPNGSWQMPWSDPSTPAVLQQFALDDQYLKTYYRAPKGYVVVRDASGRPYPVLKWAARKFGMWKPNKKPPISVGEHQAIKRADRAVKKIKKTMTTVARVDRSVSKGGKVICKKRK